MEKFFITEVTIPSNAGLKTNFSIPIEYKKVKGIFLTYPTSDIEMRMELKVGQKEIFNKLFDPSLIRFNGYLSRKEVTFDFDDTNKNDSVDLLFIHKSGNQYPLPVNIYFIVE